MFRNNAYLFPEADLTGDITNNNDHNFSRIMHCINYSKDLYEGKRYDSLIGFWCRLKSLHLKQKVPVSDLNL